MEKKPGWIVFFLKMYYFNLKTINHVNELILMLKIVFFFNLTLF